MQVDSRNPEVNDNLKAWFESRDVLFKMRSSDDYLQGRNDEKVNKMLEQLVDIADEMYDLLVPNRPRGGRQ